MWKRWELWNLRISVKIEWFFWMFGIPLARLGKMSPAKTWRGSVAVSLSGRAGPLRTEPLASLAIRGGPKRMQRFWSGISTTLLIEYHWFFCIGYNIIFQVTWHQVHKVWIMRFDSRASILRQCYFQNVLLFPASRLEAVGIYFICRLCWQKHNCPHFEKEDNMNESEAFIAQLCGTKFQLLQACLRGEK